MRTMILTILAIVLLFVGCGQPTDNSTTRPDISPPVLDPAPLSGWYAYIETNAIADCDSVCLKAYVYDFRLYGHHIASGYLKIAPYDTYCGHLCDGWMIYNRHYDYDPEPITDGVILEVHVASSFFGGICGDVVKPWCAQVQAINEDGSQGGWYCEVNFDLPLCDCSGGGGGHGGDPPPNFEG